MLVSLITIVMATSSSFFMPATAYAAFKPPPETIPQMATRIALEHHIATSSLFNMIDSESDWDPISPGDWNKEKEVYCSWGLTQQNICAHPEITKEQATDPEWALNKAAQDIEDGMDYIYTACNCYSLVWTKLGHLPLMQNIVPNSEPTPGSVAIFAYHDKKGNPVKHIAYVVKKVADGWLVQESNKTHCLIGSRVIHLSDQFLVGFWSADAV